MRLGMVGCSMVHGPAEVHQRLALSSEEVRRALEAWKESHPATEAVLLATCNRVELYAATAHNALPPCPALLTDLLTRGRIDDASDVRPHLMTLRDEEVLDHLFRVAASLDSMVVGEPQIASQVRQALDLSREVGAAGPLTQGCFQAALRAARRVAAETNLYRHRVSIPSVAIADFATQIFERFDDKRALVIGAGEMAEETLRYLVDEGARRITIVNRSLARAEELAERWGATAAPWERRWSELALADLVISATGADEPIVTAAAYRERVATERQQRPLFVLDLAAPRDFDERVGDELGVFLYGISDLADACERNRAARQGEIPRAELILRDEREKFFVDARHRLSAPVIARLRQGLEEPKQAELERLFNKLPELDERSRAEIEQFADRLVNKMLHPPMQSLRDESKNGSPHGLLAALRRLFQLAD